MPVAPARRAACRGRSARRAAPADVKGLFAELESELRECTPLVNELSVVLEAGRSFLQRNERGLELFQEMLTWQKAQRGQRHSLGPLAVAALRHPSSGREVILLGTPHNVPGVDSAENPVPVAMARAVQRLKPDLVAVELDEARGLREFEKRPKLRGQCSVLLPEEQAGPSQVLFGLFGQPELGMDEELLKRIRAKSGKRLSVKGYLKALRHIFIKSSASCLVAVFALDEFRAEAPGCPVRMPVQPCEQLVR
ncbi:unnamed protein product [Durusdinium trenchii]|uniref:Uncharacterized protein n=1 Tax=Durusdinium trenchii TaxID=1381693 RepID=A0ABP0RLT3_9DINO